jgi:hypothetical protein
MQVFDISCLILVFRYHPFANLLVGDICGLKEIVQHVFAFDAQTCLQAGFGVVESCMDDLAVPGTGESEGSVRFGDL